MPCFDLQAALPNGVTKNGKVKLRFIGKARNPNQRFQVSKPECLLLPCRQCIGCRLEKSRQWATRLIHEIPNHKSAIFLTLTYDPDKHPDTTLIPGQLSTFFKDLRARNSYYGKDKIKYFACGEYGDRNGRAHYHAALFGDIGVTDPESTPEEPSRSGDPQFTNPRVSECWPFGLHRFSELNFETAAYVARYVLKKITGPAAEAHYSGKSPEFQRSSNGLGKEHMAQWLTDIYPSDHVVLPGRGAFMPPPYYDRLLEKVDPALFQKVKAARKEAQEQMTHDSFMELITERHREGEVRKLVTDATLIRSI